jgi:ribosomal protein L13E
MTHLALKTIAALTIAASLGGCASSGQSMLGSSAGDFGALGAVAGIAAGYAGAKALGASNTASRNTALLAGIAGGAMGYQHGRVLDQRAADQANAFAQAQQQAIQRDLQLQSQIRYAQVAVQPQPTVQVPNPQPVVRPVAQALELPIARYEMVKAGGGLTPKAVKSLGYMSRAANQSNSDLVILVPPTEVSYAAAIQGIAPNARLMESRDVSNFVLIVQPRA